jgi:hypothetical protein
MSIVLLFNRFFFQFFPRDFRLEKSFTHGLVRGYLEVDM